MAVGLGVLTVLAGLAMMTPAGLALLGLKPAAKSGPPVTVIEDTVPAQHAAEPKATPHPQPALVARPSRPPAAHPATTRSRPVETVRTEIARIVNALLNLPHELGKTRVRPAPDEDTRSESKSESK